MNGEEVQLSQLGHVHCPPQATLGSSSPELQWAFGNSHRKVGTLRFVYTVAWKPSLQHPDP